MNAELLIGAFDDQIQAIVGQLTAHNAENYLDLPDGMRVGNVRRVPQPAWQPHQLERGAASSHSLLAPSPLRGGLGRGQNTRDMARNL
jgi:hypothetical protein